MYNEFSASYDCCLNASAPSEDGVRLPKNGGVIENGHTRNPLTICSVPALVQVWVHIPGDPQCSAQERYNNASVGACTDTQVVQKRSRATLACVAIV